MSDWLFPEQNCPGLNCCLTPNCIPLDKRHPFGSFLTTLVGSTPLNNVVIKEQLFIERPIFSGLVAEELIILEEIINYTGTHTINVLGNNWTGRGITSHNLTNDKLFDSQGYKELVSSTRLTEVRFITSFRWNIPSAFPDTVKKFFDNLEDNLTKVIPMKLPTKIGQSTIGTILDKQKIPDLNNTYDIDLTIKLVVTKTSSDRDIYINNYSVTLLYELDAETS